MGIIHGCYVHALSRPTPTGLHGCCCGAATSHVVLPVPVVDAHVLPLARGVDPGGRPLGAVQLLRHPAHRLPRDLPEALPADALHVDVRQLDAAGLQACAVQHAVGHQQPAAVLRHGGVVVLHVVVRARLHLGQQPPVAALVAADGDLQLVAHAARVLRVVRDRQPAVAQRQRVGLGVGVGQPGAHRRAPAPPVVSRCGREEAAERGAEVLQHISVGERGHAALDEPGVGHRWHQLGALPALAAVAREQRARAVRAARRAARGVHAGHLLPEGQHPGARLGDRQLVGDHLGHPAVGLPGVDAPGGAPRRAVARGDVHDVAAGRPPRRLVVHRGAHAGGALAVEEEHPVAVAVEHGAPDVVRHPLASSQRERQGLAPGLAVLGQGVNEVLAGRALVVLCRLPHRDPAMRGARRQLRDHGHVGVAVLVLVHVAVYPLQPRRRPPGALAACRAVLAPRERHLLRLCCGLLRGLDPHADSPQRHGMAPSGRHRDGGSDGSLRHHRGCAVAWGGGR
mmetsp:Transcript_32646/g.84625  ORF Transcript_32646/g.84625 Transcript_32646/m.84625 type:complete len:511 (+) Transcript_32646:62-1594(+)